MRFTCRKRASKACQGDQSALATVSSFWRNEMSDHAVSVAKRTVFVVTGRMPGYGGDENL